MEHAQHVASITHRIPEETRSHTMGRAPVAHVIARSGATTAPETFADGQRWPHALRARARAWTEPGRAEGGGAVSRAACVSARVLDQGRGEKPSWLPALVESTSQSIAAIASCT
jgi:hypothetical protein